MMHQNMHCLHMILDIYEKSMIYIVCTTRYLLWNITLNTCNTFPDLGFCIIFDILINHVCFYISSICQGFIKKNLLLILNGDRMNLWMILNISLYAKSVKMANISDPFM